ncbi:hypothetical protein BD309DRAFT_26541 [Dichomitus squalens]|uniref:Uncharacterized protein n=1 Tax=Dichomitus squalens TaxID=114155 RepID=A0A4Q9PM87_9APHY|nr:hypothetical protein BD309DRAFT_26541 [Dichomitus squalens]TBU55256.1 hypothetical protein BD310DRAFT_934128 [Dichomitus squalens]
MRGRRPKSMFYEETMGERCTLAANLCDKVCIYVKYAHYELITHHTKTRICFGLRIEHMEDYATGRREETCKVVERYG